MAREILKVTVNCNGDFVTAIVHDKVSPVEYRVESSPVSGDARKWAELAVYEKLKELGFLAPES